jgi:hypothetical protein
MQACPRQAKLALEPPRVSELRACKEEEGDRMCSGLGAGEVRDSMFHPGTETIF